MSWWKVHEYTWGRKHRNPLKAEEIIIRADSEEHAWDVLRGQVWSNEECYDFMEQINFKDYKDEEVVEGYTYMVIDGDNQYSVDLVRDVII